MAFHYKYIYEYLSQVDCELLDTRNQFFTHIAKHILGNSYLLGELGGKWVSWVRFQMLVCILVTEFAPGEAVCCCHDLTRS